MNPIDRFLAYFAAGSTARPFSGYAGAVVADGVLPPGVTADDPRVRALVAAARLELCWDPILSLDPPNGAQRLVRITVPVNADLCLDAGAITAESAPDGTRTLYPPAVPMYEQVIAYLERAPDPLDFRSSLTGRKREGLAAAAVCLRWGSYFAVLADASASQHVPSRPGIRDAEMARINIEASAALARWIDLIRSTQRSGLAPLLVNRAVAYLPMPKRVTGAHFPFGIYASERVQSEFGAMLRASYDARDLELRDAVRVAYPSRVFANAAIYTCWRNGPVESVHAGDHRALRGARLAPLDVRDLMVHASSQLIGPIDVVFGSATDSERTWDDTVRLYNTGCSALGWITPSAWTHVGTSRVITFT